MQLLPFDNEQESQLSLTDRTSFDVASNVIEDLQWIEYNKTLDETRITSDCSSRRM